MLNALIDRFQAKLPPNRLVALLTPLVFVPASAALSAWIGAHFPGLNLSEGAIIGFGTAAALAALTTAYRWMDGWQKDESRQSATAHEAELAKLEAETAKILTLIDEGHVPQNLLSAIEDRIGEPVTKTLPSEESSSSSVRISPKAGS